MNGAPGQIQTTPLLTLNEGHGEEEDDEQKGKKRRRKRGRKKNRKARKEASQRKKAGRRQKAVKEAMTSGKGDVTRGQVKGKHRKEARQRKRNQVRRRCVGRSMARLCILREAAKKNEDNPRTKRKRKEKTMKGGAWNVRRLGALYGTINQYLKMKCILRMCEVRKWNFCMITDLAFGENGVRRYETETREWTMIVQGKVGFLLDEEATRRWRMGGAEVKVIGRKDSKETRSAIFGAFGAVTATLTNHRKHFTRQVESLSGHRLN